MVHQIKSRWPTNYPPWSLWIFFRLTFGMLIFDIKIFGMPIFKKPIYQERILKGQTYGVPVFREPTCEVPDLVTVN